MSNDEKPAKYNLGDKVIARWIDGKRYPGMIDQVLANGNYIVLFEDGARKSVKPMHIEVNLKPIPRLELPFVDPKELAEIHESDWCDYIIKCVCGSTKDVGILIQCEYCFSWQHASCIGISTKKDLPKAYTCHFCDNPEKVRASRRYCYDSSWLKKGKLPYFSSTEAQSSENQESRVAAVNLLLDAAMECDWVLRGLKSQICLLEKTGESINPNLCIQSSIKNDESAALKSSNETKSEGTSTLTSHLSIKDSSSENNSARDESSATSNQVYSNLPSNLKASVSHNIQASKNNQKSPKNHEVAAKNVDPSANSKLSSQGANHDIRKKQLLEHILDVKSRLEARLTYIESKIEDIEKDLNLNPDDIEREEARFRKTIKPLYCQLKLVMNLKCIQNQMSQDEKTKESKHNIRNTKTKQKDSETS